MPAASQMIAATPEGKQIRGSACKGNEVTSIACRYFFGMGMHRQRGREQTTIKRTQHSAPWC